MTSHTALEMSAALLRLYVFGFGAFRERITDAVRKHNAII